MTLPAIGAPPLSELHHVHAELDVASIRLHSMTMARAHGLPTETVDRVGRVAAELSSNIFRHASTGQVIIRTVGDYETGWIEVLALDKGPGIGDMNRAMRGGASPSAPAREGAGLAGVKLLADFFDIYSPAGGGTAVMAHVGAKLTADAIPGCGNPILQECVGVVCVPVHGEKKCGDSWAVECPRGHLAAMLVDGLGHGPEAAIAANKATSVFSASIDGHPDAMLSSMHAALHRTRGAAVSAVILNEAGRTVTFFGVGNVEGRIVTASTNQHLIPQNGIVGHKMPTFSSIDTPWPTKARLVLHSDGISSRWRGDQYPGLLARHPALLAGVLFRDCARPRDDATVVVLRDTLPAPSE